MSKETVLHIEGLEKTYVTGEVKVHALNGVDLSIYKGDFVALMGQSGSGKSTMMNLLGCLDRPTAGKYLFKGHDVSGLKRDALAEIRNRHIGFVFQGFNLLHRTSALDNVQLPMIYSSKLSSRKRRERAKQLLDHVGLGDRLDHHPNQLSGGQQQRVAIARALMNDPDILLADEPTGNLDSRTGLEILAMFQRLNAEQGQTIIMVTHDRDIANCSKRQIVMQDGRIIADHPTAHRRDAAKELRELDQKRTAAPIPLEAAS